MSMRVAVSICVVLIVSLIVAGVVTVITKKWEIAIFCDGDFDVDYDGHR